MFPCCHHMAIMANINPQRVLAKSPTAPDMIDVFLPRTQPWPCGERGMRRFIPTAVLYTRLSMSPSPDDSDPWGTRPRLYSDLFPMGDSCRSPAKTWTRGQPWFQMHDLKFRYMI